MLRNEMPSLKIGDLEAQLPIVQGGMGVGISLSGLASAVADEGGIGVISTAGIGRVEPDFMQDLKAADIRGLQKEIRKAREMTKGLLGVNIMMALSDYDDMLRVSIEEKIDVIFIGAGLPLRLPTTITLDQFQNCGTKFAPIISSAKGANMILRTWDRYFNRIPDTFALEGPLAGGHLGFTMEELEDDSLTLESILDDVLKVVEPFEQKYGRKIPVIAAGGIYTGADIYRIMARGASGVKMGTRFVATHECDAHLNFKEAYVECTEEDIILIESPVGLPGRAIRSNLLVDVEHGGKRPFECPWRCLRTCDVVNAPYCIGKALNSAKMGDLEEGFAFAGANAYRVESIISVRELVSELSEEFAEACKLMGPLPSTSLN